MSAEKSNDIARGKRLKLAREMAGLTATKLAKVARVSRCSVSYWENAHVGLTRKAAEKVISALMNEGIHCDMGWLWLGEGKEPIYAPKENLLEPHELLKLETSQSSSSFINPMTNLEREIALFLKGHSNAIAIKVEDESMLPFFLPTDIVGGTWRSPNLVSDGQICIIKINQILRLRKIKKTKKGFEIISFNTKLNEVIKTKDIDFSNIAPVTRLWRQ